MLIDQGRSGISTSRGKRCFITGINHFLTNLQE